jgi:signal transduction histidine kinase/ligand-binding sensor domain-containing protein/DNA-binding response OmpR family regulator
MKAHILFVFLLTFRSLFSQTTPEVFQHLTISEGLSQNNVLNIIQDRKGFLWFATYDGLNRYDGYNFKTYKFDPYDSTSVSQHLILCIYEDRDGIIWVGTGGMGLCGFDPSTEKFKRYTVSEKPGALHEQTVTSIIECDSTQLWIGTFRGLTLFNKKKEIFTRIMHNESDSESVPSDGPVNTMCKDEKGNVWIGMDGNSIYKICKIAGAPQQVRFEKHSFDHAEKSVENENRIVSIFEDSKKNIWIGTLQGLYRKRPSGNISRYVNNPNDENSLSENLINIHSIAEDRDGNIWIGTVNGLNKLNPASETFTRFYYDPANDGSMSSNDIHSVLVDRTGILWIGTIGGGINMLDPNKRVIEKFISNSLNSGNSGVRAIYEDSKGTLWIGTEGDGLTSFDKTHKKLTHYRHQPGIQNSLCSDFIGAIIEDDHGNLWIGHGGSNFYSTESGGLSVITPAGAIRQMFNDSKAPDFIGDVFTLYFDRQKKLWIGTESGLVALDPSSLKAKRYRLDPTNSNSLSDDWVYTILEDKSGKLWLGTGSKALNYFDPEKNAFTHYSYNPEQKGTITSNSVKTVYEDSQGRIWFGTSGGGLCLFDPRAKTFKSYTIKDGLPDNTIYNILEDNDTKLWLSTNNGISCFDPPSEKFMNFDEGDGLQSNQFASGYVNAGAAFKGADGTLYFGGQHGFNVIHPNRIFFNPFPPPVALTQFKIFETLAPLSPNITLSHDQNQISFEFAALNFTNSYKNQYTYKLENFDQAWINSGNRRYVTYSNIEPGRYTFRVNASNNDGVWNNNGISMTIIILPPWWKTWWAYGIYVACILSLLWGIYNYLLSKERLKAALEAEKTEAKKILEVDKLKSEFFTNISHEFRTPLTLIQAAAEKLFEFQRNHETATLTGQIQRNAKALLTLINQILDLSRVEAGKLKAELEVINICRELELCAESFRSHAQLSTIEYEVNVPRQDLFAQCDPEKLGVIVNNLLSNAFKFTPPGGKVQFFVSQEQQGESLSLLRIRIVDTGIGIDEKRHDHIFDRYYQIESSHFNYSAGTGIGLTVVKQYVILLGGTIVVHSNEGAGSCFEVKLPLINLSPNLVPELLHRGDFYIEPNSSEKSTALESDANHQDRPLILLIEDNRELALFLQNDLRDKFDIHIAHDGHLAFTLGIKIIPEIIISDIMMPGIDGLEVARLFKSDERTCHIPIILLTAKAREEDKLSGLDAGVDDYLTKPFSRLELLARINNLIKQRQTLRKIFSSQFRLEPKNLMISSLDQKFMQKVMDVIEENMSNIYFSVDTLGKTIGMSRAQLYRKMTALTDLPPVDFIKSYRIKRAASLLAQQHGNISDVAYATGFNDPSYFSKCFKDIMQQTPSEFIKNPSPESLRSF